MRSVTERAVRRLARELGDDGLAARVVSRLDDRALEVLRAEPDLDTSPLLSFTPASVVDPQALVVFAFGNRVSPDGHLLPGPVNVQLAELADEWVGAHALPVVAQWEVADVMDTEVRRVGAPTGDDGLTEYLSTAGVAEQARTMLDVERVAVCAMRDHAFRCCLELEALGFTAGVASDGALPSAYDMSSGQPWTRSRAAYVAVDVLARALRRRSGAIDPVPGRVG